jgi:hypothetical protein
MSIRTELYGGRAICDFNEKNHVYKFNVPGVVKNLWQPSVTGLLAMKAKPGLIGWAAKESLSVVRRRLGEHQSQFGESALIDPRYVEEWLEDAKENWREEDSSTTIGTVAHRYAYEELRFRAKLTPNKPRYPIEADAVLMPDFTPAMLEAANSSASQIVKLFDKHHLQPILMERPLWSPTRGFCGTPDFVGMFDGELAVMDYKTSKRLYAEYWGQLSSLSFMFEEEFPDQVIKKRVAVNVPKDGGDLQVEIRNRDERHEADLRFFFACLEIYTWNRANDDFAAGNPVEIIGPLENARPAQRENSLASNCPF